MVVEPKPRATGLTLDEIVADHLDYLHHEAFFVVSTAFEVTAYRTLWFGLQDDSETVEQGETVGNGALATVRWYYLKRKLAERVGDRQELLIPTGESPFEKASLNHS